jgi:hypothetical protein
MPPLPIFYEDKHRVAVSGIFLLTNMVSFYMCMDSIEELTSGHVLSDGKSCYQVSFIKMSLV